MLNSKFRDISIQLKPNILFSLNQIRAKVWRSRSNSTLFDVKQYCTDFEDLFYKIWKHYEDGKAPDHITN